MYYFVLATMIACSAILVYFCIFLDDDDQNDEDKDGQGGDSDDGPSGADMVVCAFGAGDSGESRFVKHRGRCAQKSS